jgi:hypothetical protein
MALRPAIETRMSRDADTSASSPCAQPDAGRSATSNDVRRPAHRSQPPGGPGTGLPARHGIANASWDGAASRNGLGTAPPTARRKYGRAAARGRPAGDAARRTRGRKRRSGGPATGERQARERPAVRVEAAGGQDRRGEARPKEGRAWLTRRWAAWRQHASRGPSGAT